MLSRADKQYPAQLTARLKMDAPNLLYGCGDVDLAQGGLAVVGPRNAGDSLLAYAGEVGALAAGAGYVIVSGAARGIDRAAMNGALDAGGAAVCVLAGGGVPSTGILWSSSGFGGAQSPTALFDRSFSL